MKKRTHLFLAVHQEDERIQGVGEARTYLDLGLIVMKQQPDGMKLVQMKELIETKYCEADVHLDEGTYVVIPK